MVLSTAITPTHAASTANTTHRPPDRVVAARADVVAYIAPIVYTPPLASEDHVDIAVVGGGASAVLLVAALRREAGDAMPSVAVIDPADTVGLGVAYSTTDPHHRMNVRASGLSALADDPDHFVNWLAVADPSVAPHQFAHRYHYGQYLAEMFERCAGDEVTHIRATVADVRPCEPHPMPRDARSDARRDAVVLHLDNGKSLTARRVVLAIGVPPTASARFTVDVASGTGVYVPDPWAPGPSPVSLMLLLPPMASWRWWVPASPVWTLPSACPTPGGTLWPCRRTASCPSATRWSRHQR